MFGLMSGSGGGLIRYTAIIKHLEDQGEHELAKQTKREVEQAGNVCKEHGKLDDPIVGVEPVRKQLVVACPWCSGEAVLATWEAQEVNGN
jgi:hypothetical protein